jgi:hypothetical protein
MRTARLIHVPDHGIDQDVVFDRLANFLLQLRRTKLASELIGGDENSKGLGSERFDDVADGLSDGSGLTWDDRKRIRSRAERIVERRKEASGLAHLKDKEIRTLKPLTAGVRLVEPKSEHWLDEVVASLHEEMPWMAPATNEVWIALQQSAKSGDPVKIPPLLLNGQTRIGKSV